MENLCPACGFDNPTGARFCSSCGASLSGAPAAAKERKFATALFADLVGSTSLGEREDPEIVQSLVGRAFDRLSEEIERYGGLLEKFMGDAILAVFGVPTSHEDDPERAVRAGLEMQAVLSELNRSFAAEGRPQLGMRIGIDAGEVLVDQERVAGPRDRMVTGDAVNTASRLQSAAEPGRVVVGMGVHDATKDVIDYRELVPLELKGKAEPVLAWEALRVTAMRRGERVSLGMQARLVGRDEELALLVQTLQRVQSEGRPALVTMLGPAGVGKSRLADELLRHVESLDEFVYWRKGRCLSYGGLSYSAMSDAVKAQCEILEDDTPDVADAKVDRAVSDLFGDLSVAPQIRALVGTGSEQTFSREDLFDAWRRFLERMAARYPLVLVLEDIHWADGGLLDFIDHLADWAQGPIVLLTMARPELLDMRPGWGGGKRNASTIYLDPLTPDENETLLNDLLTVPLPDELRRLVVERSEGNPLYTEEIVRMLIDQGVLRATDASRWEVALPTADIDIPRSIQALIAARLDGLPADEKAVLQDAAVVGRGFWLGTVARLAGRPTDQVRDALGRLRVKEIIVPREPPAFSGELEMAFRHVLIRDVAYESLPKSLRARKHAQVGAWAEERAGERADEMAELIATHYVAAASYLDELGEGGEETVTIKRRGCEWAAAAGRRASSLWQPTEATRWYRTALSLGEASDMPAGTMAEVAEAYASAAHGVEPFDEVIRAYGDAVDRYELLGRVGDAARMKAERGATSFQAGDAQEGIRWLSEALEDLEPLGESVDLAGALTQLGGLLVRTGAAPAEAHLRRALDMADRLGVPKTEGHAALSLSMSLQDERWPEGLELMERAYALSKESGDLELFLRASNNLASALGSDAPDFARGRAILLEGLEAARRSSRRDYEAWILTNLHKYAMDHGDLEEAERYAEEEGECARAISYSLMVWSSLFDRAICRVYRGDLDAAMRLRDEGVSEEASYREVQAIPYLARVEGHIQEGLGLLPEAAGVYLTAIEDLGDSIALGEGELLLLEAVRAALLVGRRADAERCRRILDDVALGRVHFEAFGRWAHALLADDPGDAEYALLEAAAVFESLERPIDRGRVLIDLASVERSLGRDPAPTLQRARDILTACGAEFFVRQVDAAMTSTPAGDP